MFQALQALNERCEPFSAYTTEMLWADPHISQQMLKCHLDPESDLASRQSASIDKIVDWMNLRFDFSGKAVCDLGCGPGLYSERMARRGARVTGLDFSQRSIDHALQNARRELLAIDFARADYLKDDLPPDQDLVCLMYGDLCTLSPQQRRLLYAKVRTALKPGGCFVFDVFSTSQYELREEVATYGRRLDDGFWAAGDYFGFLTTFRYDEFKLALDRYLIVEPERSREIFNWLQYFDPKSISEELRANGFEILQVVDVLTGDPWHASPREFAVIARR